MQHVNRDLLQKLSWWPELGATKSCVFFLGFLFKTFKVATDTNILDLRTIYRTKLDWFVWFWPIQIYDTTMGKWQPDPDQIQIWLDLLVRPDTHDDTSQPWRPSLSSCAVRLRTHVDGFVTSLIELRQDIKVAKATLTCARSLAHTQWRRIHSMSLFSWLLTPPKLTDVHRNVWMERWKEMLFVWMHFSLSPFWHQEVFVWRTWESGNCNKRVMMAWPRLAEPAALSFPKQF